MAGAPENEGKIVYERIFLRRGRGGEGGGGGKWSRGIRKGGRCHLIHQLDATQVLLKQAMFGMI